MLFVEAKRVSFGLCRLWIRCAVPSDWR